VHLCQKPYGRRNLARVRTFSRSRRYFAWALLLLWGGSLRSQSGTVSEAGADRLVDLIVEESESARKTILIEQFLRQYPSANSLGVVYAEAQRAYWQAKQYEKSATFGEKRLALDPADLDAAELGRAAAQAAKDEKLIEAWKERSREAARRILEKASGGSASEDDQWSRKVELARYLTQPAAPAPAPSAELTLYSQTLKETDMRRRVALLDELLKQFPKTQYGANVLLLYYLSYRQLGEDKKALAYAEGILAEDQSREDVLLFVADQYFRAGRDTKKVVAYCDRVIQLLLDKPKPAENSTEDWAREQAIMRGMAHWMLGSISVQQEQWTQASLSLKAALPLLQGKGSLTAAVLSSLGWARYRLRDFPEAEQYFHKCTTIRSGYADYCAKVLKTVEFEIRNQLR
jgi:tetratricopeptide (TPR) repeat protein